MKFDSLATMADNLMKYKHVVKNVARRHGMTATFMPKPLFQDNGSGMHVHQSIWKDGKPLFAGDGYAGLSKMALYYIGGILKHARALAAFTNPGTNSYKRLVPGYEAPVNLAYSSRNRSAACRIPTYSASPKAKRVEVRFPDPVLQPVPRLRGDADGRHRRHREQDRSGWTARQEHLRPLRRGGEACSADAGEPRRVAHELEQDHEFLLKGDVFTRDAIETWCSYKRENEVDAVRLRPHPHEFELYFDC